MGTAEVPHPHSWGMPLRLLTPFFARSGISVGDQGAAETRWAYGEEMFSLGGNKCCVQEARPCSSKATALSFWVPGLLPEVAVGREEGSESHHSEGARCNVCFLLVFGGSLC